MRKLIEASAWTGVGAVTAGVYINFGLGWALTIFGIQLIGLALVGAKVNNNVSN